MANVFTGAKAVVGIDIGNEFVPVAFASSINITHENKLEEIPQLDNMLVAEYAENGHRCSFTVNFFKFLDINAQTYSLDPENLTDLLIQPELTFLIVDDTDDNDETRVKYRMTGVKFEGGSGSLDARGVWNGTWNFRARRGQGI